MTSFFRNLFKIYSVIFICLVACTTIKKQPTAPKSNFRVVGYLRRADIENGNALSVDLDKVSMINIAFINPDKDGNISGINGLKTFIDKAHQKHVTVLIAIGGGNGPAYYSTLLADSLRALVVKNMTALVQDNGLDGIDVDLEGPRIDKNYEAFVTDLSTALKAKHKLMTAAIATAYKSQYSDAALARFDFINIMSYDKTGPWRPHEPGQHAPYSMVTADLQYWSVSRGIAKDKLNVGLPFYGYGFGPGAPTEITFKSIVTKYPGAENRDTVAVANGATIFYNGISTIAAKTNFALNNAGGVMIWQLLQDAGGDKSLLNAIDKTIRTKNGR